MVQHFAHVLCGLCNLGTSILDEDLVQRSEVPVEQLGIEQLSIECRPAAPTHTNERVKAACIGLTNQPTWAISQVSRNYNTHDC